MRGIKSRNNKSKVDRLYGTDLEKNNENLQKQREKSLLSTSGFDFKPVINSQSQIIMSRKDKEADSRYPLTKKRRNSDLKVPESKKQALTVDKKSAGNTSARSKSNKHIEGLMNWSRAKREQHEEVRDNYYKRVKDMEQKMSTNSSVDDLQTLSKKVLAQTMNTPKICKKSIQIVRGSTKNQLREAMTISDRLYFE